MIGLLNVDRLESLVLSNFPGRVVDELRVVLRSRRTCSSRLSLEPGLHEPELFPGGRR
jgi:hypothetical protein